MMRKGRKRFSTTQLIILSFLLAVGIGTALLSLPCATAAGQTTSLLDALFTAVTSVCVTGLVTVPTASHWTLFGHVVILLLIQTGGLSVITLTITVLILLGRRISLRNRLLLDNYFNLDTLDGLVRFVKKVFRGTLLAEGLGAVCFSFSFVPMYGWAKGLWYSVFHAVSAFCNAGIDLIGPNGFEPFVHNVWINLVTMLLIFMGGIGFVVWWDVISVFRRRTARRSHDRHFFRSLSLHSKLSLSTTGVLIVGGTLLYLIFEYHNPLTIGTFSFPDKVLAALFESVTNRTAGFATVPQKGLTAPSVVVSLLLMFIGGSSVGTAGGVKTATVATLLLAAGTAVSGKEEVTCFHRRISEKTVIKALSIVLISFAVSLTAVIAMLAAEAGDPLDILYEVYSALGTVGLSRNYTGTVGTAGKIILCICMFLGRIGPISMVIAFTRRDRQLPVRLPEEKIIVG